MTLGVPMVEVFWLLPTFFVGMVFAAVSIRFELWLRRK